MKKEFLALAFLIPLPALAAEPLLKNTGFDKELKPWKCEDFKLVPDPEKKGNSVLEFILMDWIYGLSQNFRWPADREELTLSFRVKLSPAQREAPVKWRLCISGLEESAQVAEAEIQKSGEWITVSKVVKRPTFKAMTLTLDCDRAEGKLWIDDVMLE